MGSVQRGLQRGVQQIAREKSWPTTLLLLAATLTLTQLFLVFLLAVNGVGRVLVTQAALQVEVLPTAADADIQALYAALRNHPSMEDVQFVTSEQAYQLQKARDPELISFLEEYKLANPFPDTFAVTLVSLNTYDDFVQEIQKQEWRSVVNPASLSTAGEREQETRALLQVTDGMRTLSMLFLVLAVLILFFVILEWVTRTASRRGQELVLEHLLGAPGSAVLLPFAMEMTILLMAGTLIGTILVLAFINLLPVFMPAIAMEAPFRMLQTELMPLLLSVFPLIVLVELIAMPVLAYVGTWLGVKGKLPDTFTLFS